MPRRAPTKTQTRNLHRTAPEPGQTKTARLAFERLMGEVRDLEADDLLPFWIDKHIPEAWDTLERDVDVTEKKVRVTLLLDESVAKFYRGMGQGYQARINRVLATFAQMRIAQVNVAEARIAKFRAEEKERMRAEGE